MSTDLSESVFILPDILAEWPWKRTINPLSGLQARAASLVWIPSFCSMAHLQRALEVSNNYLLSSLAYPRENEDVFRVGCDLMNWFFSYDEYSDAATPNKAQHMATIVMDAIRNPDKATVPISKHVRVIGEATRRFWELASQHASIGARHQFIKALDIFTTSVAQQAQDHAQNRIKNVDEYFSVRRGTIETGPLFAILEFGLNLPDEVFEDPVIQRLTDISTVLIILINDMCSYNIEQARGDDEHNLVTILMRHENLTLDKAMEEIDQHASKLVDEFLDKYNNYLPFFDTGVQADLDCYLKGLGNWVRANDCWHFESGRYFGEDELVRLEMQKSRKVVLLPRLMPSFQNLTVLIPVCYSGSESSRVESSSCSLHAPSVSAHLPKTKYQF